jgi:D-3-phosphoglycerate dehydrogenase
MPGASSRAIRKALVLAPFAPEALERLRQGVKVVYQPWTETRKLHSPDDLAGRIKHERIDALVVEADVLTEAVFSVPRLQIAGACRNAPNQVDLGAATAHGVPVVNTPSRNNTSVAELTIAFMLALGRNVQRAHEHVAAKRWTDPLDAYSRFQGREVAGSAVGIVGLGQIGREVAARAKALGARVVAHDPFVAAATAREAGVRLVSLPVLLRSSDFVTLHTGSVPEPLLDEASLDQLQPGAFVINTGSPNALDYDALAERLQDGRIAGAALDVFPGFILNTSSPLLERDNVILTPHIGGATRETIERHSAMIVDDIERFADGKKPRSLANPDVWKQLSNKDAR